MLGTEQARLRASIADIDQRQRRRRQRLMQHWQRRPAWWLVCGAVVGFLLGRAIVAAPQRAAAPGGKLAARGLWVALLKPWLYQRYLYRLNPPPD